MCCHKTLHQQLLTYDKNHTQKIHLKKKQKISATCKFINFKYIYETTYISFAYRLFDSESFI